MLEPQPKSIVISKTFLVQVVALIIVAFPKTREFLSPYAVEAAAFWGVLNIVLRMITKDKVKIV